MKKTGRFIALVALTICLLATVCFAEKYEYYPDDDGLYTVSFDGKKSNEYILIVLKGIYNDTNYIEAWKNAPDSDILYYDQEKSDDDGKVTFGSFAPTAYFDSTVIIGGTNLSQPVLLGYVRKGEATNIAKVEIDSLESYYVARGVDGDDTDIAVKTLFLDSFGYPAVTDEKAVISAVSQNVKLKCDPVTGVITVDKCSPAGEVTVKATYGDLSDTATFEVRRLAPSAHHVLFFAHKNSDKSVQSLKVDFTEGNESTETEIYSAVFDMYGDKFNDTTEIYVNGVKNTDGNKVKFTSTGKYTVKAVSVSNESVYSEIEVNVVEVPAYTGVALELYNLIKESEEELSLIGTEKFISENGGDIYPDALWTTEKKKSDFEKEIALAKADLEKSVQNSISQTALGTRVKTLTSELSSYKNSFSKGKRIDAESITFDSEKKRIPVTSNKVALAPTILPKGYTEKISWSSSDENIVSVDENGNVVAKKNGTAIISAVSQSGVSASIYVTSYTKATRIQLAESSINLTYGSAPYVLGMTVYPEGQSEIFIWTSSNPDIATVSSSGVITARPKAGTARITVVGEHGVSAECEVKVTLPKWETVKTPTASVAQGNVLKKTAVTLTTETPSAQIYYTLDGSEPTVKSRRYTQPIVIESDVTIKAFAVADKMFDSGVATYSYSVVVPKISVTSPASLIIGKTGELSVSLSNNPGIKQFSFKITVPAGTVISSCADGIAKGVTFEETAVDNVYLVKWTGTQTVADNGVLTKIVLNIGKDTAKGEFTPVISDVLLTLGDGKAVEADGTAEKFKISDVVVGDVNGDGSININDLILFSKYLAGWESAENTLVYDAADTNGDGKVDINDIIRLSKYCAGWDVVLG